MDEFRAMMSTFPVDIIAVTETWINTSRRDFTGEYILKGYSMFKFDRVDRNGGGVMLYVRRHLMPVLIPNVTQFEITGVELKGTEPRIGVFVVYRPPRHPADQDENLYRELSAMMRDRTSIIVGDFNCNIDWISGVTNGEGMRLLDFRDDNFLTQMVHAPTRGQNTLDLIFTSDEDLITDVEVGECLANSDHHTVTCRVIVGAEPNRPAHREMLNLRRADYRMLNRDLQGLILQEEGSAEEMWSSFKASFLAFQANRIPLKRVGGTAKVQPRWFSDSLGREIKKRKRLYSEAKTNPSPLAEQRLVEQRRLVKRMIRRAKVTEEHRVCRACRDNPKEFFVYVNSHKPRVPLGPVVDDNGFLVTSDAQIASEFNNYFVSVFTTEDVANVPNPVITYNGEDSLVEIRCTESEIEEKIKALNPNKAPGPDGFLPKVMKAIVEGISPHLCKVYNRSLETGVVPQDMRSANVSPIFKKGVTTITGNFRPISLTSVPGKVLESIIKDRIVDHLDRHSLIGNSQHGFRSGRSCLTNLLEFFRVMFATHDQSKAVDVVYLDFKKAFDKVPHRRLMLKVRALGIRGSVAAWIEAWLTDRRQRVVVNGATSGWSAVSSGVPQGSVLGPLLFLIYINDLDVDLVSKVSKFADDTKLGINAADPNSILELRQDLVKIGEWSEKWQMPFNTDKCHVLHVGSRNPMEDYQLLGTQIASVTQELDLGVLITNEFKFSAQCIAAEKKAQRVLGYIKRVFRYRNKTTVLHLYNALVRPLLEYAVQFWSPSLQQDIARLEKVQARATKLVPAIRLKGYQRRLNDLRMFTLEQRRLRGQLIETFKILRGFNKVDPSNYYQLSENPTRNHGWKVVPPRFNTSVFRDFMTVRVCNVWNSLPEDVVNAPSVDSFKSRLDSILADLRY